MFATMPRKPKGGPRHPVGDDRHKNLVVAFRPGPELRAALLALATKDKRALSTMVEILVEEALAARGVWPPVK